MTPFRRFTRCVFAVLFLLLCVSARLHAQSTDAHITGVITDPSKAVIPGAKVYLISVETGTRYPAVTNKSGIYSVSAQIGTYRIEVEHVGFKSVVAPNIVLHTQDALEINFEMAVGSASETVTVTAEATQTSGTVSTVIDHAFIENMPLNGNSLSTLFELTPGVVTNANGGSPSQGGGLSVNGQRGTSNYLTVDGASENIYVPLVTNTGNANVTGQGITTSASGGTNGLLPTDAVEEYRIQTSTYSAEYGRTPGGQIGIRTRGGSNDFHGSVFENFRNQVMDATDYFIKFNKQPQSPLRMNDFGGTLGGPILRDKLFFFVAHESLLMTQPQPGNKIDVPSACAKTMAATVFQPFLAAYPMGNQGNDLTQAPCSGQVASSTNPSISDILSESFSNTITDHSTSARVDANLPWRSRAFFRFNYAPSNTITTGWSPYNNMENIWTATGGVTSTLSTKLVNELTINSSQNHDTYGQFLASYGGNNPSTFTNAVAGISNLTTNYFEFAATIWGAYPVVGPSQRNSISQWNAVDSLSWTFGRHSLKFGGDYLWRNPILHGYNLELIPVVRTFSNLESGTLSSLSYAQYYSNPDIKVTEFSLFANDTWRLTKALTLNYGIRWELNPSPSAAGPGLFAIQGNVANPSSITQAPAGTSLFQTVYTNFAPRFGFAYSLRDNPKFGTVIRGGVGIFFDTGTAATAAQAAGEGYPYKGTGSLSNVSFSSVNWGGLISSTPSLPQGTLYITDPNIQAPRTYEWSLTLEQGFGPGTTLSLSYVGNDGQKLVSTVADYDSYGGPTYFTNPLINATYGEFAIVTNGAESNYQSLQAQLRSHLTQRLDAIASWTWSHDINDGDSDFSGPYSVATYSGRSDSANDIRHIFSTAIHYSPQGFHGNRLLKAVTGGWSLDTIALLQTASPFSVKANVPTTVTIAYNNLANVVPGVPTILHCHTCTFVNPFTNQSVTETIPGGKMLNPAAFAIPTCACNGNSPMNGYRLYGLAQWDLAGGRSWNLWDKASFEFRAEAFNILNTANFANVENLFASNQISSFGRALNTYAGYYGGAGGSSSGALNAVFSNGGARSIQLSAKIKF